MVAAPSALAPYAAESLTRTFWGRDESRGAAFREGDANAAVGHI